MSSIEDLINELEVPAMPNVIVRALNILKNPDSSSKELAQIVSYDQSLCTKVLTLVNSAYYGFNQQITSISRAITLLGMSKTKSIIITVAMRPMLTKQGDKELWEHSIKTAVGCEFLAKNLKAMDPDEAFVIGFLHDLGKIILHLKYGEKYEKALELVRTNDKNIIDTEQAYFNADHSQLGSFLAKKWQLPLVITNAIKYHHNPENSSMKKTCTLVYLVNLLVQENWTEEKLNNDVVLNNLNIKLDKPEILRENILKRAQLLLNELSD
jgi:putative nucleotidyltransferase with HDIG domain